MIVGIGYPRRGAGSIARLTSFVAGVHDVDAVVETKPPKAIPIEVGSSSASFSGMWTSRDLAIDCEFADMQTTDPQVLYSK
jgi:hypothetical protein